MGISDDTIIVAKCEKNMSPSKTIFERIPTNLRHLGLSYLFRSQQSRKNRGRMLCRGEKSVLLLLPERHTIGTLIHSRIHLVSTYHNAIQRTIVLALTMMGTLLDGTLNTFIGTIHLIFLLCLNSNLVWPVSRKVFRQILSILKFTAHCAMMW